MIRGARSGLFAPTYVQGGGPEQTVQPKARIEVIASMLTGGVAEAPGHISYAALPSPQAIPQTLNAQALAAGAGSASAYPHLPGRPPAPTSSWSYRKGATP